MRITHTSLVAIALAAVAVEAAPAAIKGSTNAITKREDLENALSQLQALKEMRAKREMLETDLQAREYAIVTSVLEAIKDTNLAPTVLKFFVSNNTLKNAAIDGVVLVVKSGLISATQLLTLLTQSGLITTVINDVIGNCEVYASILSIAETVIGNLLSKRATPFTHEEGLELLRRDGLIKPTEFDVSGTQARSVGADDAEKRDVDEVLTNILESLASSGLASQVVETVLTDTSFISFGAELVKELYDQDLLHISTLVSAVTESGLLSALIKDLANFDTLKTIFSAALSAFDGECDSSASTTTTASKATTTATATTKTTATATTKTTSTSTATSTSTSSSGLISILGSGLLSGAASLLGSLFGDSSSDTTTTSTTSKTATATATATATTASTVNPCATNVAKRERMRLY